jgi:caffeoyl-CoA O-methyltransferase
MGSPPVKGFGQADPALAAWAAEVYRPEDPVLREVRARSAAAALPAIEVGPFDGLHLEVLARLAGARRAVEIGTLGGYSGICLLRGMGEEGFLHTFEVSERHAQVARQTFALAGVAERVAVHVGPAAERLRDVEGEGPFDLVFVDADKTGYPEYLAWAAVNLKVGGVIIADNTFGFGQVHRVEPRGESPEAMAALREFSRRLASDGTFRATMLPTAEGMSVGVKVR